MGTEVRGAEPEYFQRFGLQFRVQHIILFVSTILLILTGIPLWLLGHPEYMYWTEQASNSVFSLAFFRFWHKVGAVGLMGISVYHILWTIYSREGRREFIALLPYPKDVVDVTLNSLYFLGLRKEPPKFRRYTYFEKFDYWAVYWGCVILIGSGLVLWFDKFFAKAAPWFPYELAALIHADEAILATLALFIWHFYNVHFKPSRFPMSGLWWHGRISREEMMEEHPLELEELTGKQR